MFFGGLTCLNFMQILFKALNFKVAAWVLLGLILSSLQRMMIGDGLVRGRSANRTCVQPTAFTAAQCVLILVLVTALQLMAFILVISLSHFSVSK